MAHPKKTMSLVKTDVSYFVFIADSSQTYRLCIIDAVSKSMEVYQYLRMITPFLLRWLILWVCKKSQCSSYLRSWQLIHSIIIFTITYLLLLEVKKIPTELLCGLGDVYWEAESRKWCLNSSGSLTIFFGIFEAKAEAGGPH